MQIIRAQAKDIPTLQKIAKRVIQANYTPFLGPANVANFIDSGQADNEIADGIQHCYMLQQGVTTIGFAIVKGDLLHLIMVDVPYQHRGYGAKLLALVEGEMLRSHPIIKLQTFEQNTSAVRFYMKNGWTIKSIEYRNEMGLNMLYMEKQLKS